MLFIISTNQTESDPDLRVGFAVVPFCAITMNAQCHRRSFAPPRPGQDSRIKLSWLYPNCIVERDGGAAHSRNSFGGKENKKYLRVLLTLTGYV
jgi:hypothetical protein